MAKRTLRPRWPASATRGLRDHPAAGVHGGRGDRRAPPLWRRHVAHRAVGWPHGHLLSRNGRESSGLRRSSTTARQRVRAGRPGRCRLARVLAGAAGFTSPASRRRQPGGVPGARGARTAAAGIRCRAISISGRTSGVGQGRVRVIPSLYAIGHPHRERRHPDGAWINATLTCTPAPSIARAIAG